MIMKDATPLTHPFPLVHGQNSIVITEQHNIHDSRGPEK